MDTLFLDDCGYNDGESIAREIRAGNLKSEDLDDVVAYLSIDEKVIGLNRFVSDYIRQAMLGILNTLDIEEYGATDMNKIELVIDNSDEKEKKIPKKCEIIINGERLEVKRLDAKLISNSVKSMVSSLKLEEEAEKIDLKISDISEDAVNAEVYLNVNDRPLEINEFVRGILKETTLAILKNLKISEEIEEIQIVVEG